MSVVFATRRASVNQTDQVVCVAHVATWCTFPLPAKAWDVSLSLEDDLLSQESGSERGVQSVPTQTQQASSERHSVQLRGRNKQQLPSSFGTPAQPHPHAFCEGEVLGDADFHDLRVRHRWSGATVWVGQVVGSSLRLAKNWWVAAWSKRLQLPHRGAVARANSTTTLT